MRTITSILSVAFAALALIPAATCHAEDPDPHSIEWVCERAPDRVRTLFNSLDYTRSGLAAVQAAVQAQDYPRACAALIEYYRTADTAQSLRLPPVSDAGVRDADADSLLNDRFSVYGANGRIKRKPDGGVDWSARGPKNDPEWNHSLNNMFPDDALLRGYKKTGHREYVTRIDADVRDWILSNPVPDRMISEGPWQGMVAAARARNWMNIFYGLQGVDEFSPAARILMLSSLRDHADYLQHFHHTDFTNRCVIEMQGLGTIGCAWPEFRLASMWRSYTTDEMNAQMQGQVYPDGVHTELTASYHRVVTEQFGAFIDTFHQFGYDVSPSLVEGVRRMWRYLAMSMRPDGTTPQNNDSDRRDIRDKLRAAAQTYQLPELLYVASNGASGAAPDTGPSVMFPWAGQLIMRSNWKADAQWAFFDVGPLGTAHQHRDKLNLCIDAFGRALLVDAGRYSYRDDAWRAYFTGTQAHNTIIVDGNGQNNDVLRATAPVSPDDFAITPQFDFARGTFSAGYVDVDGTVTHMRAVLYVKGRFWVVVDRIDADRPHAIDALWHFAPACHVRADGADVVSDDAGAGNLRITSVGGPVWTTSLVSGRGQPDIQGWNSPIFGQKEPETCAVFHANLSGSATFAWVLVPASGDVPKPAARMVSNDGETVVLRVDNYDITIPVMSGRPKLGGAN